MTSDTPHAVNDGAGIGVRGGESRTSSLSAGAFLSLGCMEGMYEHIVTPIPPAHKIAGIRALPWSGYAPACAVAVLAYFIHYLPIAPFAVTQADKVRHPVSAAIIAILVGLLFGNTMMLRESIKMGCKKVVKRVIPVAIVLAGAGLNLIDVASVGSRALVITVICIGLALAAGYYFGRLFGLGSKTSLLLGVGTGICGNSAIVAVAPLIDAEDNDLALSVGTINLYGLLAMLAWPLIGGWLAMGDESFGIWSGASIHAVPQVVAAGYAYSSEAGAIATGVKLVRVALLAPMVFALALIYARHHSSGAVSSDRLTVRYARLVPWFVWGFVVFALLNTFGLIPTLNFQLASFLSGGEEFVSVSVSSLMTQTGKILLTLAMAAIGLEVNIRQLAGVGRRGLAAGLATTVVVGAASLVMIRAVM